MLAAAVVVALATPSAAIDTIETWAAGEADVEFYLGFDGAGLPGVEQTLSGAMVLGWGLADRFSTFVATGIQADGYLTRAETELDFGIFGTPLDTDHVDLDLLLDLRASGPQMSEASVVPAVELNLDREPDLGSYGLFLRGAAEISSHEHDDGRVERHVDLGIVGGAYYTVSPGHQILAKYGATVHERAPGHARFETGAVSVGYNAMLTDYLELITATSLEFAHEDRDASVGFVAGVIATFPSTID